jgi:hypothetical protein
MPSMKRRGSIAVFFIAVLFLWNIRFLFAFCAQMTQHLAPLTQEMMREPSELRPGGAGRSRVW